MWSRQARRLGDLHSQEREKRLVAVKRAVDDLLFGIAEVLAMREPDFGGSVTDDLSQRIRAAFAGVRGRIAYRPDFGDFAHLRVTGALVWPATHVTAVVDFCDRSVPFAGDLPREAPALQVRLELVIQLQPCVIQSCSVTRPLPFGDRGAAACA